MLSLVLSIFHTHTDIHTKAHKDTRKLLEMTHMSLTLIEVMVLSMWIH